MFHEGGLQSGIGLAVQQAKAVLCFVHDDTEVSAEWEAILNDEAISRALTSQAVALRLEAGSQEAAFLTPICAINSTPAVVVIKDGQVQTNLQSVEVSVQQLRKRLASAFGMEQNEDAQVYQEPEDVVSTAEPQESNLGYIDLQPQPGQMRLPNNAYDALRNHTQKLLDEGISHSDVFETQLTLLNNIPIFKEEVSRVQSEESNRELSEYARSRLLRLPAVGLKIPGQATSPSNSSSSAAPLQPDSSTNTSNSLPTVQASGRVYPTQNRVPSSSSSSIPRPQAQSDPPASPSKTETSEKQKAQRAEYIRMQRDRENAARTERERIKAQIKADREERRRLDDMRKGNLPPPQNLEDLDTTSSTYARTSSRSNPTADVRVQVRTFNGSTLRNTFSPQSTITTHLRPWIDSATDTNTSMPYNLKMILTPLPNRTIEAGEEDTSLSDLGVVGSCTFVMVPVKGYVESYSSRGAGLMGQNGLLGGVGGLVGGGYNLVSGTAGWAVGGVKSLLGYGGEQTAQTVGGGSASGESAAAGTANVRNMRVRTLADQRAEEAKKDHQFYNGNQLNFEPRRDEDGKKD